MAEALGFKPTDRVLLLHADDMGMTELTNKAVKDVLDFGIAKSASIMVPAPGAKDAIQNPIYKGYDLGLHISLNSEWRKLRWTSIERKRKVRSLTTPFKGYLWRGRVPVLLLGRGHHVYREVRAQVQLALNWGMEPTHMDSHMGTVLFKPSFGRAYLEVAKEFEIPPMLVKWSDHLQDQLPPIIMNHLERSARLAEEANWLLFDYIYLGIDGDDPKSRREGFIKEFKNLKPGVSMMFFHPAYFGKKPPFPKSVVTERSADTKLFTDPAIKKILEDEGIKLITWRDIQKVYEWDKVYVPDI